MKEHDLVLSLLSNPELSIADFQAAGYTVDNTGIETNEKDYKKYEVVQDNFKNPDGSFDDQAFHEFYTNVNIAYNGLSQKHTIEELYNQTSWKWNNTLAPEGVKRRNGPDIYFTKMLNPGRDSWSTVTLGKFKEGAESTDEIAQSNKVLANPVDVENGAAPIWHDSPNDSFWTDFWDTRVLAQWDYDADENGKRTSDPDKIVHPKGSLKYNDKGEPYYENLQGRDIYGRKVLNKLNTLTVDGSDINKYDFFDSDDKQEKSVTGTLMKNLALVGTMFIPYVGPVIAGLSMGTQVTGMAAKLGKMISGSDNPTLSAIEGWTESWNRQTLKSEYAQNNTWCWENMIDVVGDLVGQLREQRIIFQYVPALFKGTKAIQWNGFTKEAENLFKAELAQQWKNKYNLKAIGAAYKTQEGKYLAMDLHELSKAGAQIAYQKYMKDYYKIGEVLSKMYMAGLISSNMYSEAKANGVSDEAASIMTFGRFAAEMGLLYTPMGNAILPELRVNKLANKAMIENLIDRTATFGKVKQVAVSNASKMSKFKDIFKLGSRLADKGAERVYANNFIDTFKASFANGTEVGIVNDIEEFLNDMVKTTYNYVKDEDSPKLSAWDNMVDRYGMGMVSGLVGGTLTSAFTNYGQVSQARATTPEQAIQQMVYLERQGELDKVIKSIDNYTVGDKNLSATEYDIVTDKDGNEQIIWKAGTKNNNQDLAAKQAIRLQAKLIKQILDNNGINISDESFLKSQSPEFVKEIKFEMLLRSFASGRLLQKFNSACSDIVRLTNEINAMTPKTDAKKATAEKGEDIETQSIEQKKKQLKEAVALKDDILKGKYRQEFIRDVIYELSPAINHAFIKPSFVRYVEYVKHKPISEIPENELNDLKEKWEAWKQTDMKDYLHISAGIHQEIVQKTADIVRKADQVLNDMNDPILKAIQNYQEFGIEGRVQAAIEEQQRANIEVTPEIYNQIISDVLNNTFSEFGLQLYKVMNSEENFNNLMDLITKYNSTRNDQTKIAENQDYAKQIDTIIRDSFNNNIGKFVNPIIERGYINSEVRNVVLDVLQQEMKRQVAELNVLEYRLRTPAEEVKYQELQKSQNLIKESIDKIKELPHTPIEKILNEFSITAKGEEINITDLIDKLNGILKGSISDPSAILLGNEIAEQINQALQLIDVFEVVIEGAKNDAGQMNNLLGYNHYLNLLMPETNAPEISTQSANVLIQDLRVLKNKLSFFKQLNAQNQAQKASSNYRSQLNFNYLSYDRLKTLKIPESWEGKEEWKSVLSEAEALETNKGKLGISKEARNNIDLEMLKIRNGLYDIINKNLDKLDELFSMQNFNYFDTTNNIFNEASEALNDASLLGWIIDSAALKYTDFKKMLIEARGDKIAPLSSQELAVYKQLGRIVNGKFYKAAYDAIRKNIVEYWKNLSKEDRIKFGKKLYPDLEQHGLDLLSSLEDVLDILPSLRYLNEVFIEGIPGTGKTNAVLPITMKILQAHYKDLLKNVAYVHGGNLKSAKAGIEQLKKIGIDVSGFTPYTKQKLLETISEWTPYETKTDDEGNAKDIIPDNRMNRNQDTGEYRSSDKIKFSENPFSLIIFDEATNANAFEHDVIDAYGDQYGTITLSFGDLDQDGSYGNANINGVNFNIGISSSNFLPGIKLGLSMRVNNSQKAQNLKNAQQWVNSKSNEKLELHYFENENGLFGEKVFNNSSDADVNQEELENTINLMVSTLKDDEKIGYIVQDKEYSRIYDIMTQDKYKDKIEIFDINSQTAQGLEAQYYIVDIVTPENNGQPYINKSFRRHIYTGLSRSSQGTLIINNPYSFEEGAPLAEIYNNIQDDETISQELPVEEIKRLSDEDVEFWKDKVEDGTVPERKNIDVVSEPPKADNPVVDEGNGEVFVESIPTLASQETVEHKTIEESKVKEPVVEVQGEGTESKPFKLSLCYYTFNKYETGIYRGQNGEAIQWGNNTDRHKQRIDSANGLINLDRTSGHSLRSFDEYRIILDQLHSALLNAENVNNLYDRIKKVLTKNGFGDFENSGINIKFGFKSSADAKRMSREFSSKDEDVKKYGRFDKGKNEQLEYIHAEDSKSLYINNKSIVLVIGDSRGDFLEIPYIQLPHVGTVIDQLSVVPGDNTHSQIQGVWNNVKHKDDAVGELLNEMQRQGLDKIYPDLVKLGEVFRITNNVFVDLSNWNPYSNLINFGIQGVYNILGTDYGQPGYTYTVPFIPITQLAENSEIKISPVLYSKTADINDGVHEYKNIIEPGLPFVLVTYDTSIDDLVQTWLSESLTPNKTKKVQRVYVVPPRATIGRYLDNLVNIFDPNKNKSSVEDIGNDVTAYKLTKILLSDQNFRDNVTYNLKQQEFAKLDKYIEDLNGLDNKTLVKKLQGMPEGQPKTYKELFRLFLKELVQPTGQVVVKYKGFDSAPNRQLITDTLNAHGVDGVYYQVRPPKTGQQEYGRFFFKAEQNENWDITKYNDLTQTEEVFSYTIHGKIDSNVYNGDSSILDIILKGTKFTDSTIPFDSLFSAMEAGQYVIGGSMFKGNANEAYINGKYTENTNQQLSAFSVGTLVSYLGKNYTIKNIVNGNYELSGNFGRESITVKIETGDSSFITPESVISTYKVGDLVTNAFNETFEVLDVDPVNYLLKNIDTGEEVIASIDSIDNSQQVPQTKFKVGDKITLSGGDYSEILEITKTSGQWTYKLLRSDGRKIDIPIESIDTVAQLYQFIPYAKLNVNNLEINISENLTIKADLSNAKYTLLKKNIALAQNSQIEHDTSGTITVTFDNGTKINIQYDPDSNSQLAIAYLNEQNTLTHTEQEWNEILSKVDEDYRDIVDVSFQDILELKEIVDGEYGQEIFKDNYDIVKNMIDEKTDYNECNGISLTFK